MRTGSRQTQQICRPKAIAIAVVLASATSPVFANDPRTALATVSSTTAAAQYPPAAAAPAPAGRPVSAEFVALETLLAEQRSERVAQQRMLERVLTQQSALTADLEASMRTMRESQSSALTFAGVAVFGLAALFALLYSRATRQLITAGNQRFDALETRYERRLTDLRGEWRDELHAWREALPAAQPGPASAGSLGSAPVSSAVALAPASPAPTTANPTSPLTVDDNVDTDWQWLTAAPQHQYELGTTEPKEPLATPQGDLTLGQVGTMPAAETSGVTPLPGELEIAASHRRTVDPAFGHSGSGWPASIPDPSARAQLALLELHDDLRQQLTAQPDLLRSLVQESLAIVLEPAAKRSLGDWRLLVLDAWRRDNLAEALARTDSMIESARDDAERITAHEHRALVLDRMHRMRNQPATAQEPTATVHERSAARVEEGGDVRLLDAMLREGVRLRRENRDFANARRVFETLLRQLPEQRGEDHERLWMRASINLALVESAPGGTPRRAITLYESIESAFGGMSDAELNTTRVASLAQARFNRSVLAYERLHDVDGATAGYEALVAAHRERSEPAVVLTVAHALSNHAWLLAHERDDATGAVALYRELYGRFGKSSHPEVQVLAASGLFAAAALTARSLRDVPRALATYNELTDRFGNATTAPLVALVAKALFNSALLLGNDQGRRAEAIETYGRLLARSDDIADDAPQLAELVAASHVNRGGLLVRRGDAVAARQDFEAVIARFASDFSPRVAEQVVRARFNLGGIGTEQGDFEGAIGAYRALLGQQVAESESRLDTVVARALSNLAFLYANPRRETQNALAVFATLLERFRSRPEAELAEQCARALVSVGVLKTTRTRDYTGAVSAYDELVLRYGKRNEAEIADRVAKGLFNLAALHAQQRNDVPATLQTLTTLVDGYRDRQEPDIAARVASGLLTKARILDRLRDTEGAADAYRQLITSFERRSDPQLAKYVAAARQALGQASGGGMMQRR